MDSFLKFFAALRWLKQVATLILLVFFIFVVVKDEFGTAVPDIESPVIETSSDADLVAYLKEIGPSVAEFISVRQEGYIRVEDAQIEDAPILLEVLEMELDAGFQKIMNIQVPDEVGDLHQAYVDYAWNSLKRLEIQNMWEKFGNQGRYVAESSVQRLKDREKEIIPRLTLLEDKFREQLQTLAIDKPELMEYRFAVSNLFNLRDYNVEIQPHCIELNKQQEAYFKGYKMSPLTPEMRKQESKQLVEILESMEPPSAQAEIHQSIIAYAQALSKAIDKYPLGVEIGDPETLEELVRQNKIINHLWRTRTAFDDAMKELHRYNLDPKSVILELEPEPEPGLD